MRRIGRASRMMGAGQPATASRAWWATERPLAQRRQGVRPNCAGGTDHGTAGAAFVLGGSVGTSKIIADWPGLGDKQLFEGRDLASTTDNRAVLKGVVAGGFDLTKGQLDKVFPPSRRETRQNETLADAQLCDAPVAHRRAPSRPPAAMSRARCYCRWADPNSDHRSRRRRRAERRGCRRSRIRSRERYFPCHMPT